jgi:hypothetical protein
MPGLPRKLISFFTPPPTGIAETLDPIYPNIVPLLGGTNDIDYF